MIGIVHGGFSSERKASTENATYINESLIRRGYETVMLDYAADIEKSLALNGVDFVYLCVQGKGHGDGTLQALLDHMGIPYTGSDMTSAALINDKIFCKEIFRFNGIPTPDWTQLSLSDYKNKNFDASKLKYPVVSKAPTQGAACGIALIRDESEIKRVEESFEYDDTILLEAFCPGISATVGLLQNDGVITALPCIQIIDSDAKKGDLALFTGEFEILPAPVPESLQSLIRDAAVKTFNVMRCRDYARVDFIVDPQSGKFDVLEINAVPGLQPTSFLPNEAKLAGIPYDDLIEGILLNARRRANV